MNEAYLTRFWGSDFRVLTAPVEAGRDLPPRWAAIASDDRSSRLEAFKVFIDGVFVSLPETAALLREKTTDAYLVKV